MSEAEVERGAVRVRAFPCELPGEPVLCFEGQGLTRGDRYDGGDVRVPAVVHQSSCATRSAVPVHAATSSSVQARGVPSW